MTYIVCFEPDQKKEYRIIILILPIDIKNHFLYDKVKNSLCISNFSASWHGFLCGANRITINNAPCT